MLTLLTNAKRLRAGKLLILLYLLCVFAPSLGSAFFAGARAASCVVEDEHGKSVVHPDEEADHVLAYAHVGGRAHDEFVHIQAVSDDESGFQSATLVEEPDRQKCSPGQCCRMACINALTATVVELTTLPTRASRCEFVIFRRIADRAPAALYRPPNS